MQNTIRSHTNTINYSWIEFDRDIAYLYDTISNNLWFPDFIMGIKRGGLVPAIKLSHLFNKPMIMMACQLRDGMDTRIRLLEPEVSLYNKNLLIVDDICDSGQTFEKVKTEIIRQNPNSVKTCAIYYNTEQRVDLDFYARSLDRTHNKKWIMFPWEE